VHRFVLCIFVVAMLASPCFAQVQPGSTGGSIGKTEKSISGGADADRPRAAPLAKRPAANEQETSSGGSCGRIVGTWSWYLKLTESVFDQNGAARNSGGTSGNWTCAGATIRIAWANGYVDRATVSPDGKSISVVSTWGGGINFIGRRRGQD
jgi:hypothetical protein